MELRYFITSGNENYLKCSICKNYLSCFPISMCSNGQHVCGRCTIPNGVTSFNDKAYETLAEVLKFPCRYSSEGCFEEILPQKVKEHEENCPFRIVECIVEKPSRCEWQGPLSNLFQHCKKEHSQVILEDGEFEVGVGSTQEYDYLVEVDSTYFIFRRKFDVENRVLEFTMFNNQYDSSYTYIYSNFKLKAKNAGKSISMDFQPGTYEEHSLGYFELKYVTTDSRKDIIKIILKKKKNHYMERLSQKYNSQFLENLKCSNCSNSFISPIYQCVENSNNYYCLNCKSEHDKSPLVKQSVILEKFASFLKYPCENFKNGCLFEAIYPEIKTHQINCTFKKRKCPSNFYDVCTWEGLEKDTYRHVLDNSRKHYVEEMTADLELSTKKDSNSQIGRIIHFSGKLFFLINGSHNSDCVWLLTKISPCNDRFRYEIDIIDQTNKGRRLLVGKPCCNNFEEFLSNYNKNVDYKCIVNDDQFSSVFKEQEEIKIVKHRLRIFKC